MENERMEHMDHFRERFEALERRIQMVERRLRWWRGIACGFLLLGLLTWALPSGRAADPQSGPIADQLAALRGLLTVVRFDAAADEVVITGANLRIVNGLGATQTTNGLGNLIVGYNEPPTFPARPVAVRTGSHNVVVGQGNNFSSFGGLVVGFANEISGAFAVVSGGQFNTASGLTTAVSGGSGNRASGDRAVVSGGANRTALGEFDWVAGPLFADF
jgi:hypothetical protein